MKITVELDVEPEVADGWDTPADAEQTARAIEGEFGGMDFQEGGIAFFVRDAKARVVEE